MQASLKKVFTFSLWSYFLFLFPYKHFFNDPDTFWHLSYGRWMIEHGKIPTQALGTLADKNLPFTPHEYGFQLLMASFEKFINIDASFCLIPLFFLLLAYSLSLLFIKSAKEQGLKLSFSLSFLISLISVHFIESYLHLRPQIFSYALLIFNLAFIVDIQKNDIQKKHFFIAGLSSLLLANVHGGMWIFLLALWGLSCLSKLFDKTLGRKDLFCLGLVILCGLLNPSFYKALFYFKHFQFQGQENYIQEWKPVSFYVYVHFVPLLIFLWSASYSLRKNYFRLLMGGFTLIIGLLSVKTYVFFFLFLPLFLALPLAQAKIDERFSFLFPQKKILYSLSLFFLLVNIFSFYIKNEKIDPRLYPVDEIRFLKTSPSPETLSLYTNFGLGGFILYQNIPTFSYGVVDAFGAKKDEKSLSLFEDALLSHLDLQHLVSLSKAHPFQYILFPKIEDETAMAKQYFNYRLDFLKKNFGEPVFEGRCAYLFINTHFSTQAH